jgi:non-lysosomal glucosylceramidase
MDRRDLLKAMGASGLLAGFPMLGATQLPSRLIPDDKGITPEMLAALKARGQRHIYKGHRRFALGMPCGGIAAGQLYLLGDGALGGWHIDGRLNATGWGSENYKVRPQPRELMQGFTLRVSNPNQKPSEQRWIAARLADPENSGSFEDIEFIGEFPVAEIRYGKPSIADFPIDVTLKAGSPFIPLNAKDSCLPCTLLRFSLKNTSTKPVLGQLVGFLENGIDRPEPGEVPSQRRNRAANVKSFSSVVMDAQPEPDTKDPRPDRLLFDFEAPDYKGWEVRGTAFGDKPATGKFPTQQPVSGIEGKGLVNSYADNDDLVGELLSEPFTIDRHFLTLLVGGGNHRARACVNLLVDGKPVRTTTGRNYEKLEPRAWDVRDLAGKLARIQIVDAQKGPWGHINVDSIRLVDTAPPDSRRPQPDSLTFGTLALAGPGLPICTVGDPSKIDTFNIVEASKAQDAHADAAAPLIGALAAPFTLEPGESKEIAFVLAWHFPNLHTNQGVMYSNWFKDANEVAAYVFENLDRLTKDTDLFRKTWYDDTTLPWWLAARLFMPTSNLATGTAQWWKNGRFWGWEGVGCCSGTCTHVWNYSHAEARLFPELARSTRTMQDLGAAFEEATGRVAFRGEVNNGAPYAADGQSGTVLKCYREHLCSPDNGFLKANWPRVKKVLDYQIARDALARGKKGAELKGANPDGIIEVTQHNTYDINFEGPNTFVGALYLAALLAGARMADLMGDKPAADQYRALAARGRAYSEQHLFDDGYFIQQIPEDASTRFQYGSGCLTDQLFGQNWARCLALGAVYDETKVQSALRAIYRHNFCPAVGQYNAKFPPERTFAEGREAGLFICTWPLGGRPNEPIRYRDEVWTGCEYQAAGGMLWENLVDEALVIIKAIDDRYDGAAHNPWNEIECGDHYARAMASYGAYQALCGFTYDGPAGVIGIAPRLNPDNFAAFFAGAEGWGLAIQSREEHRQANHFEVRHGRLRVSAITTQVPTGIRVSSAAIGLNGNAKVVKPEQVGTSVTARLEEAIALREGMRVSAVFQT